MIARYATPEMTALWSEAEKYRTWLEVELAATEARALVVHRGDLLEVRPDRPELRVVV